MQLPRRPLGRQLDTAAGLCRSGLRAGFTLIELLAAMLILGILMAFLIPKIPEAIEQAKITASKKNLQEIYGGLLQYEGKFEESLRVQQRALRIEIAAKGEEHPSVATSVRTSVASTLRAGSSTRRSRPTRRPCASGRRPSEKTTST